MNGLEEFELPDVIDKREADEKGYIGRVREEEKNLNTFVFENSDGTKTIRVFDYPVKYEDKDGRIKDITNYIRKAEEGTFETKDNSIRTKFPKYFNEGITLNTEKVNIELIPKGMDGLAKYASTSIPVQAIDNKTVSYCYGENTTLEYGLTYTGFKEDIVVSRYTGQTEYDFILNTNGLYLEKKDGSYYLVDANKEVQATIGDIIIFTADEANNTMGYMTSQTLKEGKEYLLTIHIDAEYLRDEKTVYPIRIDPTIEINYEKNGAGAIQDVTICSSKTQNGSSGSLYIGKRSDYGICRVLMKFPTLSLASISDASNITNATVEIRDLMCETTAATIQCYAFNGNAWEESTATWSNTSPNSYTAQLSSNSISYANGKKQTTAHRYRFDITTVVKGWKTGTYTQSKGIMFKADSNIENGSTYNYKTFASYNRASYKPSLSISYNSFSDAISLATNVVSSVNITAAGEKKYYKFVPPTTGFYTFESSNIVSGDPYAWLYNTNQQQLVYSDDISGERNFKLTYHMIRGYTYYLVAGCYGSGTGKYNVKIISANLLYAIDTSSVQSEGALNVACNVSQGAQYYMFKPKSTGEYLLYSSSTIGDPRVWLYDENLKSVGNNDDSAGNRNFRMVATLYAGNTYYIVVDQFGTNTGKCTMNLLKERTTLSEVCYLKNIETLQYMDVEGPGTQEWVHQWTAHLDMQEKWTIERQSDGYYTIRSRYGNKYYVGIANKTESVDNIKLYSSITDSTKWKIYELSPGVYVFEPKTAIGKILCTSSNATGARLRLAQMGTDDANRTRWNILNKGKYYAQVNNYFDDGYSVFYDELGFTSREQINGYMNEISKRYYELLGLRLLYDTAGYYESPIDSCKGQVSIENIDSLCDHSGTIHTDRDNVISAFMNRYSGSNKITNILWSCHQITTLATSGEVNLNRSCSFEEAVFMLERSLSYDRKQHALGIVMHELNHQFGVKDHYHELAIPGNEKSCKFKETCSECGDNPRDAGCIMNDSRMDIYNSNIICDDCKKDIINHLNGHHTNK